MELVYQYLTIVNVLAFVLFGIDKYKAIHKKWRISETVLLVLAGLGGGIGAYLGMRLFHHKTRKKIFCWGIPMMVVIQVALSVYLRVYR